VAAAIDRSSRGCSCSKSLLKDAAPRQERGEPQLLPPHGGGQDFTMSNNRPM
jgi:hypothetical protein